MTSETIAPGQCRNTIMSMNTKKILKTQAQAYALFKRMRKEIKDKGHACEFDLKSLIEWSGRTPLIRFSCLGYQAGIYGINFKKTILGDLIRISCFPNGLTQPVRPGLWEITNRNFEQLCAVFSACLVDKNFTNLLDWFDGAIRSNRFRGNKRSDVDFRFGLANVLIRLCATFLVKSDDLRAECPAALLLYQIGNSSKRAFERAMDTCIAADLPAAIRIARGIQLFHLAHRAIEISYTHSWQLHEKATQQNCAPSLGNPWQSQQLSTLQTNRMSADTNKLLPFYCHTASWLMLVTKLRNLPDSKQLPRVPDGFQTTLAAVPNTVFLNLTAYCRYLREFGGSPTAYDPQQLAPIVDALVSMISQHACAWPMRLDAVQGLLLLVPKRQPLPQLPTSQPTTKWYGHIAALPKQQGSWRLCIVPSLLLLADHWKRFGGVNGRNCDPHVPVLELFTHLFLIPEHRMVIAHMSVPSNCVFMSNRYDMLALVLSILERAKMLVDIPSQEKRRQEAALHRPQPVAIDPDRPVRYLNPDVTYEPQPTEFGRYTIHLLIEKHLRLLMQFILQTPVICHQPEVAQQIAALLNNLLYVFVEKESDRERVRQSNRLYGELILIGWMIRAMAECAEFVEWMAKYGNLQNCWRLSDMFCQTAKARFEQLQGEQPRNEHIEVLLQQHKLVLRKCLQLRTALLHFERELAKEKLVQTAMEAAPEEFYDIISARLMQEPVRLPASRMALDRTTIERHLQEQSTDPFTRTPLQLDEVLPEPELRDRIAKWKRTTKMRQLRLYKQARAQFLDPFYLPNKRKPRESLPEPLVKQVSKYLDVVTGSRRKRIKKRRRKNAKV